MLWDTFIAAGQSAYQRGDFDQALEAFGAAADAAESLDAERRALSLNNLAACLQASGRPEQAIPLLQRALETVAHGFGEIHPEVAVALNNLAGASEMVGRLEEAEEHYLRSLETLRGCGEEHRLDYASCLANVGVFFARRGQLVEAADYLTQATTSYREAGGNESGLLALRGQLFQIRLDQGDLAAALIEAEQGLGLARRLFPEAHPALAQAATNLGLVFFIQGDYGSALEYFEQAHTVHAELGPDLSPATRLSGLYNRGAALQGAGRLADAEQAYKQALGLAEEEQPHPLTLRVLLNYAQLLRQTDRPEQAETMEMRASRMAR